MRVKRWAWVSGRLLLLALTLLFIDIGLALASGLVQGKTSLRLGGELYDNWFESLGISPPDGNMPVWSRQTTNTTSGPDTWRCATCHGRDYQGNEGAYRAGSNYTGFPGLLQSSFKDPQAILDQLTGQTDPDHDYSNWMDENSLNALVEFITQGLVDDDQFIDPVSLEVIDGNAAAGMSLYEGLCAKCHGVDGTLIQFHFDGLGTTLGTLAVLDPWRFLHKTRYGTPGTAMGKVVGVEQEWTAQQGRDVLKYAQSLPTGLSKATPAGATDGENVTPGESGVPAQNWLTGILKIVGSIANSLGLVLLGAAAIIGILLLVIWAGRAGRK
jgi:mono/diheme cytochrome c family protein